MLARVLTWSAALALGACGYRVVRVEACDRAGRCTGPEASLSEIQLTVDVILLPERSAPLLELRPGLPTEAPLRLSPAPRPRPGRRPDRAGPATAAPWWALAPMPA